MTVRRPNPMPCMCDKCVEQRIREALKKPENRRFKRGKKQ